MCSALTPIFSIEMSPDEGGAEPFLYSVLGPPTPVGEVAAGSTTCRCLQGSLGWLHSERRMDAKGMNLRGRGSVGVALLLALAGCGGNSAASPNDTGSGGNASGGMSLETGGGGSSGAGGSVSACPGPLPPAASLAAAGRIDIPVRVVIGATPMAIGSPATGRDGTEYKLSKLKFFLSEPAFVDLNGRESPAQIVGADGRPLPYGIQLVDADDAATQLFRLSTTQGSYTALRFGVGVPPACNVVSATDSVYPLNPDSEMFWTWASAFQFLSVEGTSRKPPATDFSGFFHHVGYDPAFAHVSLPGSITVGTSGNGPTLSLDVDRMLSTDGQAMPSGQHGVPEGWVVDNLENNQAFSLR